MADPRYRELADTIVRHSLRLAPGEKVLVETFDVPPAFAIEVVRAARRAGGLPVVDSKSNQVFRELVAGGDEASVRLIGELERARMEKMDAYVGIRGSRNVSEMGDVAGPQMKTYQSLWLKPVHFEVRVPKTKWVVLRWPTSSMAQLAQMSTEAFEDFFFRVCLVDYAEMRERVRPLADRMSRTDRVRIVGPGTDLSFSIRGIPVIPCTGEKNLPDGECFTAPVKDSVEGTVRFNAPTIYLGRTFQDVRLSFRKGKIVETSADDPKGLAEILDTDPGARYVGEFSIAFNPQILRPMKDILFDEKIAGSFHFTPGNAYEEADNGNRSEVHWDLVQIQRPDYGGGEIWFDGELVRKDGRFVPENLRALDPA
ncbi:MAG: aminopeptidase [Planctomycetes bacterium]|nr:aminopeptidase [Planctomycetota bacterium]